MAKSAKGRNEGRKMLQIPQRLVQQTCTISSKIQRSLLLLRTPRIEGNYCNTEEQKQMEQNPRKTHQVNLDLESTKSTLINS
jgi:hypothetical protein